MRTLWTLLLTASAALVASGADKEKPKTVTLPAEESAAGWLLLQGGDTTFGWEVAGPAKVKDRVLVLGGNKKTSAATTTAFGDFELHFDLDTGGQEATVTFGNSAQVFKTNGWAEISIKRTGNQVNTESRGIVEGSGRGTGGPVAATPIRIEVPAGATAQLRHVKLKPLGLKAVFNGKDLTGWKPIPGKKSKFSVTEKGWLRIQNGPGDLQTTGQWGDFVLQLAVFTNGKHLNSGVFFRAIPGQFWSGYEAQIQNQVVPPPGKEYRLEVFDPKTHKRVAIKKEKYPGADYGTGGIYNRQPARRVVSRDKEWFTMTVIAHGKHLAVWVNGYQTADFTDHRPVGNNARSGCKIAKGPISLQGHDATTDLFFRNIRMAELPRGGKKK
jgi:hypothetical protein